MRALFSCAVLLLVQTSHPQVAQAQRQGAPVVEAAEGSAEESTRLQLHFAADRPGRSLWLDGEYRCDLPCDLELERATVDAELRFRGSSVPAGTLELARPGDVDFSIRGQSTRQLTGKWLLHNGLLVGVPISIGAFINRDDLGGALTWSVIGINTVVALVGAILMAIGDQHTVRTVVTRRRD